MRDYYADLVNSYKVAENRAKIYDDVIKVHKADLKNYSKNSKEYSEITEMIKFIKAMEDYKRVNKNMMICLFGMSNIARI